LSDTLSSESFVEPTFGENAYVLSTRAEGRGRVGWVIDPSFPPQVNQLLRYIAANDINVEKIILTHGHADHIAGLDAVRAAHPAARVYLAAADQPMLYDANKNLSAPFGLPVTTQTRADSDLAPGATLRLGDLEWLILDTSGHSPGGRSLYCQGAGVVISGDALFAGSIGRTDFPGCDHAALIRHIRENLLKLPENTLVYSGHGPPTTIGNERKSNPYVSD